MIPVVDSHLDLAWNAVGFERDGVMGVALDNWMLFDGWRTSETARDVVTLANVADHIDNICQLAGHHRTAAIGTDLDGGFGRSQVPAGVDSSADMQNLSLVLARRGYGDDAIEAIFHGNWLRWLRANLPSLDRVPNSTA